MGMADKVVQAAGKAAVSTANSTITGGRLVLCFDGTGNKYQGDTSDTNIVQLFRMFKRDDPKQWHYYQPGIGTYTTGTENINVDGFFAKKQQAFNQAMDQGFASSFDEHVAAGYKFLMRYYDPGDQIYIFGFSRGAFTARFLARMIGKIGLLSKGNEEMVPFAYSSYQSYEQGTSTERNVWFDTFKQTFCRTGVSIHFLGLFDCVRSVANFESAKPISIPVFDTYSTHVRHAVSIDEARAMFKPALMSMDEEHKYSDDDYASNSRVVKERWFPGNHGDVGGGWTTASNNDGDVQLSSLALEWMLKELKNLPEKDGVSRIQFNDLSDRFLANMKQQSTRHQALTSRVHSVLKWNGDQPWWKVIFWKWAGDESPIKVLFWKLFENLWFKRKTLAPDGKSWVYKNVPNRSAKRPIPLGSTLDVSVLERIDLVPGYRETLTNENVETAIAAAQAQRRKLEN